MRNWKATVKSIWEKNPIVFCLVVLVIYFLVSRISLQLGTLAPQITVSPVGSTTQAVKNLIQVALLLIPIGLVWHGSVLRNRGLGVVKGLGLSWFTLVGISVTPILVLARMPHSIDGLNTALTVIGAIFVGMAEEFMFRGVIATTCLDRFGTSHAGIWKAVVLSSVIFGGAHLMNLGKFTTMFVISQVLSVSIGGTILCALYFRTGNIWVPVLVHAYRDFAVTYLQQLLFNAGDASADAMHTASQFNITSAIFDLIVSLLPAIILLRQAKVREAQANMRPILDSARNS